MPGLPQARTAAAGSDGGDAGRPRQMPEHESTREAKLRRDAFVRKLPAFVQESVAELESLDEEVTTLEAQFRRERRQLERRFEALYAPLLARRAALIGSEPRVQGQAGEVSIPDFWLCAMKSETAISCNVTLKDEPALKSLRDVTCSTLQESKGIGFCLQFYFAPNKYFSNHILAKTYHLSGSDTEPVLERAEGTDIRWKPGMNLTVKLPNKSIVGNMVHQAGERCFSFFNFFQTLKISSDPVIVNQVTEMVEADYELARAFKDKLVPHAVRWFTTEAEDSEDFRSEASGDTEEAAEEFEAARLELALDAAVSDTKARALAESFDPPLPRSQASANASAPLQKLKGAMKM